MLAGNIVTQLFAEAVIYEMFIVYALVNTGLALSMFSTAMYKRMPSAPAILPFTKAAPNVYGVGAVYDVICSYVDPPIELDVTVVHHLLLIVNRLAFSI